MKRAVSEALTMLGLIIAIINPIATNPYCFGRYTPLVLLLLASGLRLGTLLDYLEGKE